MNKSRYKKIKENIKQTKDENEHNNEEREEA